VCAVAAAFLLATFGGTAAGASRSLPPPVNVRPEPEGITLGDPAFDPLPGARADFGRLGGAVYQLEMPEHWNHRLVLFMHGFEEFGSEANVTPPDIRAYLIGHGYAWGASSFSSTSQIPGRSADETAALWDFFASKYGRPTRTYVTGLSMGGAATHIAAERYADRFDGALALCGSAGQTPGLENLADFAASAAYVTGITQAEVDASPDIGALLRDRVVPALQDPALHKQWEDIELDLTGGPRPFGREGFRVEEETNWRRAELAATAQLLLNRDTKYRLGPLSNVASDEFNRDVVRFPVDQDALHSFAEGQEITGKLAMPMLSLHTTGDGQVPIAQAQILQRRVDAAGTQNLLVQRVIRDAGHCGFRSTEMEAGLEALVRWVEHDVKPDGTNVLVRDLRTLNRTFELAPRELAPGEVPGVSDRTVVRGHLTLDGAPFDSKYLGADVVRNGLMTHCQTSLPPVDDGRYKVTVMADAEAPGCGAPGARIVLWTFANDKILFSPTALAWPGNGHTISFDANFSASTPDGAAPVTSSFVGEVFDRHGRQLPGRTRVEAYVGTTLCGVASVKPTGSFSGFSLAVVGPDAVPGCDLGAMITFRVNGQVAAQTGVNEPRGETSLDLTLR
jgi:pimeloyl-ACP methyl ester carboxylesterase